MAQKKSTKSKLNLAAIVEELKTPAFLLGGMVIGTYAGKVVDKVLKVDETAADFQIKSIAKPVLQISVGALGAVLLKDKNMKLVASGIAASGVVSGVKTFLKKDILNGFGEAGIANVFQHPVNLSIEAYNPDLPDINPNMEYLPIETQGGDLSDYQEIGEIEIL